MSIATMVREFHDTYGFAYPSQPTLETRYVLDRVALTEEETRELIEAVEAEDLVEVADALADLIYVVYGSALTYGLDIDSVPLRGTLPRRPKKAALRGVRTKTDLEQVRWHVLRFIVAVMGASGTEDEEKERLDTILDTLVQINRSVRVMAARIGLDLDALVAEVHRSNMTKTVSSGRKPTKEPGVFSEADIAAVIRGETGA